MTEYIEREKVLKEFEYSDIGFYDDEPIQTRNRALKIIQNIPTADVRPVVRGRWKPIGADKRGRGAVYMCVPSGEVETCGKCFPFKTNFCPNCGADMREVDDGTGADV